MVVGFLGRVRTNDCEWIGDSLRGKRARPVRHRQRLVMRQARLGLRTRLVPLHSPAHAYPALLGVMDGSLPAGWALRLCLHPVKETDLGAHRRRNQAQNHGDERDIETRGTHSCVHFDLHPIKRNWAGETYHVNRQIFLQSAVESSQHPWTRHPRSRSRNYSRPGARETRRPWID